MPDRKEFKKIALTRLKEVKVLHSHKLYNGAVYLTGYVVEMALKARICRILDSEYPETGSVSKSFLTHDFDTLIKLGGLENKWAKKQDDSVDFKQNWSKITDAWNQTVRYKPIGEFRKDDVEKLLKALEDKNDGVLTWIKSLW